MGYDSPSSTTLRWYMGSRRKVYEETSKTHSRTSNIEIWRTPENSPANWSNLKLKATLSNVRWPQWLSSYNARTLHHWRLATFNSQRRNRCTRRTETKTPSTNSTRFLEVVEQRLPCGTSNTEEMVSHWTCINVGDLVLVAEDNEAPLVWKLARVSKLFKGNDEIPRVAEIKTSKKTFNRPVIKLRKLPLAESIVDRTPSGPWGKKVTEYFGYFRYILFLLSTHSGKKYPLMTRLGYEPREIAYSLPISL